VGQAARIFFCGGRLALRDLFGHRAGSHVLPLRVFSRHLLWARTALWINLLPLAKATSRQGGWRNWSVRTFAWGPP